MEMGQKQRVERADAMVLTGVEEECREKIPTPS